MKVSGSKIANKALLHSLGCWKEPGADLRGKKWDSKPRFQIAMGGLRVNTQFHIYISAAAAGHTFPAIILHINIKQNKCAAESN